jgi:hypothetical protein
MVKHHCKTGGSPTKDKEVPDATVNKKQKQWLKSFVKKPSGLKHVMAVLAKEENSNAAFVSTINALQSAQSTPPPLSNDSSKSSASVGALSTNFPVSATKVQLNSILHHHNGKSKK